MREMGMAGGASQVVIAGLAGRRNEPPQPLTSSSAKADDPVRRAAQDLMGAGDYWIPAFAGMTAVFRGRALPSPTKGEGRFRTGYSSLHPHRHQHVERAFGILV